MVSNILIKIKAAGDDQQIRGIINQFLQGLLTSESRFPSAKMNHLSNILTALRSADNDGLQQKATWNVVRAVNIVEALLDLEYESLF